MSRPIVLFLCTANSARSQMAEALLGHLAGDRFDARSAGISPSEVHPLTLRVLAERGVDTSRLHSKPVSDFLGRAAVRHAIIVCEKAQQNCPRLYPFSTSSLYWPFDDPAQCAGSETERLEKFREVCAQIEARIRQWLDVKGSG